MGSWRSIAQLLFLYFFSIMLVISTTPSSLFSFPMRKLIFCQTINGLFISMVFLFHFSAAVQNHPNDV